MERSSIQLEKIWPDQPVAGDVVSLGSISVRVVVFESKLDEDKNKALATVIEAGEEFFMDGGRGPLDSYLERPGGKGYVVFLVHGQRHDALDETFVGDQLGFKYLRKRSMVVVDVDALTPEAIAELVQGSRQGFYRGEVYYAILSRIVAVLEGDPDLKRLEAEAEQDISELKAGDEAVRNKLDALIEGHHSAGERSSAGTGTHVSGHGSSADSASTRKLQDVVVRALPTVGASAQGPVLVGEPDGTLLRIHPGEPRRLSINSIPEDAWKNIQSSDFILTPPISELSVEAKSLHGKTEVELLFREPDAFPDEDYPITGTLTFIASFKGQEEPRVLERELLITKRRPRTPRPETVLRSNPTFLRVVSRQPIKLIPGGPSTHVRLRWDGEDELSSGSQAAWCFHGQCTSLLSFPSPLFSSPRRGNFEMLVDTPHGLLPGQILDFQVEAVGPSGETLSTSFRGQVAEPPIEQEPRMVRTAGMEGKSERHPPYELKYIDESQWGNGTCWGSSNWTKDDGGCFTEPTESMPLTLIINQDAELLRAMREDMKAKKLEEVTVKERQARYSAHIAFHLYQMYLHVEHARGADQEEGSYRIPSETELRSEINRVSATLLRLMDR